MAALQSLASIVAALAGYFALVWLTAFVARKGWGDASKESTTTFNLKPGARISCEIMNTNKPEDT